MAKFESDPLVAEAIRLLTERTAVHAPEEEMDALLCAMNIIAADQRWYYIMQLCLPYLECVPSALRDVIDDIDDEILLQFLLFSHRLNDAFYLRLGGRKAVNTRIAAQSVRLPGRRWNIPYTDRWIGTADLRTMLEDIRKDVLRLPTHRRPAWASDQLRKRCAAMNARLRDGAAFQLTRHAMATGSQWYRASGYSKHEAVHIRLHYNSAFLTIAVQVGGARKHKTKPLIWFVGQMLSDEERSHIDMHYALRWLSIAVFRFLWMLRTQSDIDEAKLGLGSLYGLLLSDSLNDPRIKEEIAKLGAFPTLTVTTHGALSQIPFSALHDGTHYLGERFNVVQAGPQFVDADFAEDEIDWETLTGGEPFHLTELRTLSDTVGLAHARHELDELRDMAAKNGLPLAEGVSNDWTDETLSWLLSNESAALLSTHIEASPANPRDAFVIAPEGSQLRIGAALQSPISTKLLMLSGCLSANQTDWFAQGENSMTSLFRRAGVETVVSTLWPVRDYVARIYNVAFIRALTQGAARGVAHGIAQRTIMQTTATVGQMGLGERIISQHDFTQESPMEERLLLHPGYWSAFILTGAWK